MSQQITNRQILDIVKLQLLETGEYSLGNGVTFTVEMCQFRGKDWSALVSSDRGNNVYYLLEYDYTAEDFTWRELLQTGVQSHTATF